MPRNKFCDRQDLHNEADVEQVFVRRLLAALGYQDRAIRPKVALEQLTVGSIDEGPLHRPDFALKVSGHIRWIVEAKAPSERLELHIGQADGYCSAINTSYKTVSPVEYFVLSNGFQTNLYRPGTSTPVATLTFSQFVDGNPQYKQFAGLLRPDTFRQSVPEPQQGDLTLLRKPTIWEANYVFAWCHQHIHTADKISQAKGFEEFVKLIALKLMMDKTIRDDYPGASFEKEFEYPTEAIPFSQRWITEQEATTVNPVNTILFKRFMDDVARDIALRIRKPFFEPGEQINLKPETIKAVVGRLEDLFLFGIDADLNGRLFEEFLSATMRGKDLGQYFTPRTLVKLGVGLGAVGVDDLILDGCCGTGGFLIDALSHMWAHVNRNVSMSDAEKEEKRKKIADEQIYRIDFGKSPNLAKLARLNMFLHGDGGSRIFNTDALDLELTEQASDASEEVREKRELRDHGLAGQFDVVLTNPPFSKRYERKKPGDRAVLDQYEVAHGRASVAAKMMFFEMYHHYLRPGGILVSVIDDGFLGVPTYKWFRETLRSWFIIRAVVSLPGDAFQRSDARVKTSFVVLQKRNPEHPVTVQPPVFMYGCQYVGNDDPKRQRWMPGDENMRVKAMEEVEKVVKGFRRFLAGDGEAQYVVPPERLRDRLDVKHCLIDADARVSDWEQASDVILYRLADAVREKAFPPGEVIECVRHQEHVQLVIVTYAGMAVAGRTIYPKTETKYPQLYRVRAGDIVMSNIAASYGSVTVIPKECDGMVVSKEHTVLSTRNGFNAQVVCAILRSPEMRAELLLRATGANRTRVKWDDIANVQLPYPNETTATQFVEGIERADVAHRQAEEERNAALNAIGEALLLGKKRALYLLAAFKPPR